MQALGSRSRTRVEDSVGLTNVVQSNEPPWLRRTPLCIEHFSSFFKIKF